MFGEREYYLLKPEELLDLFTVSAERGLSAREVRSRQLSSGLNIITEKNGKGLLSIFFSQFKDFMIIVLMVATLLSLVMGEFGDGITICAIIVLNGIMGFIQEFRAEKSLAALKKLAAPQARTLRNSKIEDVDATELVPGDVIFLETGDRVPADLRILSASGLQVDESLLTGESLPVNKSDQLLYARGLEISNQLNMLFMGTTVNRGRAKAIVVNTGMDTEMGRIAELLESQQETLTPLQKRLKHLGKWLVTLTLLITLVIVLIGIVQGQSIYQMLLAGVSLAVAAIPEGLPAIVTLVLALGIQKMIKNNAIVRRLQAVETLGCATVICSDKTGTLTKNEMALKKIYFNHRIKNFSGQTELAKIEKMLKIGAICGSVQLKEEEKTGTINRVKKFFVGQQLPELKGDPTETALVRALYQYDLTFSELSRQYPIIAEEPFDSSRKRMSVLVSPAEQKRELWIKGAPEVILNLSEYLEFNGQQEKLTAGLREEVLRANEAMAGDALRVLAIAYRPLNKQVRATQLKDYENNLILIGLVGLIDPPRPEAYQAVQACFRAGIKPVMITGDHKITARVIAEELAMITRSDRVVTGEELRKTEQQGLKSIVGQARVYARISPEDKLRIVRALKENGEIVAMTGDGVNDAPALKEADIGIAMGEKGSDVTKEVSSLILADDNFTTIVKAIAEGRKIYNNIRKFIRYLLACNTGELLAIFTGIVLGLPLPLLPIQILWVNLVTDGLPALALGMDNDSDDVMKKPPREPEESIFANGMVSHIAGQGALIGISTMLAFLIGIYRFGLDLPTARTMAFSTLVFSQLFFVFSCRSEDHSFWEISPFKNMYLIAAVTLSTVMHLLVIYLPFFSRFFQTRVLTINEWVVVFALSIWSTILVDLVRFVANRKKAKNS